MPKQPHSSPPRSPILIMALLLFLCVTLAGALWSLDASVRWMRQVFGEPAANMGKVESVIYAARLYGYRSDLLTPADPQGPVVFFEIKMGESVSTIANRLEQSRLIRSAEAFRLYLIYAGLDTRIQAGRYQLSPAKNAVDLGRALIDATPGVVRFATLAGWRAEETASLLPNSGLSVTSDAFLQEVRQPSQTILPAGMNGIKSLEGYLFPGTYDFKRETTLRELTTAFIKRFDEQVTLEMRTAFRQQGLDLPQAVTLASIVEREAMDESEQRLIASVFYNRLKRSMPLQSDPTAQYARGYNNLQKSWWTNPLSTGDLNLESSYNTYKINGLPPGPICSPGLPALKAVANPAQSTYLYFRAKCDQSGLHNFANDYAGHVKNACP